MSCVSDLVKQKLNLGRHVQIKLLGDSITHGVGGTGFEMNGGEICCGVKRNPDGYCWAKTFKTYMENKYDCTVINNGIGGITIEFIIEHFDELVEDGDDLILCTIGTNNRHQYHVDGPQRTYEQHTKRFYDLIFTLHGMLKAAGKDFIFVANIPAAASDEVDGPTYWRIMHMNDIDDLYKKAWCDLQFPFISMYDLFHNYCAEHDRTVDSLLIDGLHPNDEGYDVMFALLKDALEV